MGKRRSKGKARLHATQPASTPSVFAEFHLVESEFEIESGFGKSFLANQRIVWMTIRHRPSGRTVKGKIGTTKKGGGKDHDELLRYLLKSFRR